MCNVFGAQHAAAEQRHPADAPARAADAERSAVMAHGETVDNAMRRGT